MACRAHWGSKILLYLGLVLVASTFCQCSELTRWKASIRSRRNATLSQSGDKSNAVYGGRLLIFQQEVGGHTRPSSDDLDVDSDYQADMGWDVSMQSSGPAGFFRPDQRNVRQLLQMDPKVECTADSMKLQVQDTPSTPGSLILVDRGSLSPLPLSMLPQSCGYTIGSTPSGTVLVAPYNGCFVTLQEDSYVLPLLWWGLPVRMTCPLMGRSSNTPMVTCHAAGMFVKFERVPYASDIKIKLNGTWEGLITAAPKCRISVVEHKGVTIFVRYDPCVEKEDGLYTVLLAGQGETKVSCPSMTQGQSKPAIGPTQAPKQPQAPGDELYPPHPVYPSPSNPHRPVENPMPVPYQFQPGVPPVPQAENEPDTKPVPALQYPKPQQPEVIPGHIHKPDHLYPYPLYPMPSPGADLDKKPMPVQPEVPPGHENPPLYPFPMPWPGNKPNQVAKPVPSPQPPKPQPEVLPGHIPHPVYPSPSNPHKPVENPMPVPYQFQHGVPPVPQAENEPDTKPVPALQYPKPQQPEVIPGHIHKPDHLYPYPLYPMPSPGADLDKTPMPVQPEVPPGHENPFYPFPMPWPGKNPNQVAKPVPSPQPPKPQQPEVLPGHIHKPVYPYQYPLYPLINPIEDPDKKPMLAPSKQPEGPPGPEKPLYAFFDMPWPEKKPGVQLGQDVEPAYPNSFYPVTLDDKPVVPPLLQPQKPGTQTSQTEQPLPEMNPNPKLQDPEISQGEEHQPVHPYSFDSLSGSEPKPMDKPMPALQQPECPPGNVLCKYPYSPYPLPGPEPSKKPMPLEPKQPEVPPCKQQQPAYPHLYPFDPVTNPKEPGKKPLPNPWPFQHKVPLSYVEKPVYSFFITEPENKPVTKPVQHPQPPKQPKPELPPDQDQQAYYPYTYPVYPVPLSEEISKNPIPSQQSDPKQPELPLGHAKNPVNPYPYFPFNSVPVIKPPLAPQAPQQQKPKVPGKTIQGQVHMSFQSQIPQISDSETYSNTHFTEKPEESEKRLPVKPLHSQKPQWHPLPPYSPNKHSQQVKSPAQSAKGEASLHGSTHGCVKFCTTGYSNCCPQIAFHQHLYHLTPSDPDGKVIGGISQGFPYVASVTYGLGDDISHTWPAQKPHDSVLPSSHSLTYESQKHHHQLPGGNPALLGSNPIKAAAPEIPIPPFVPDPNVYFSSWPYETEHSPQGQSSPQVAPQFGFQNPFHVPVKHGGQNQNGAISNSPDLGAMSYITKLLQQHQHAHQMPTPMDLERPSPSQTQGELGPLPPYAMLKDEEAAANTSSVRNYFPHSSLLKRRKSSKRDSYEPKGYMLLQRGPPGKTPGASESEQKIQTVAVDQTVPAQRFARKPQHRILLGKELAKPSNDDSKSNKHTSLPYVPVKVSKVKRSVADRLGLGHRSDGGSERNKPK
ncbi:trithorax group protein osa-like [Entelurus aequoreus]|uniref:trithorax group protein osa-like n=1 Tax=Entelurus aequoreus TaxID=161455 RepID=UPI002B1D7A68|nr:trithorax group protein osa-like [Entelurus aequoreus]